VEKHWGREGVYAHCFGVSKTDSIYSYVRLHSISNHAHISMEYKSLL